MTPVTKHYRNPAALLFDCPRAGCREPRGVMCYGDTKAPGGLYQHYFHQERVRLADATGAVMPQTQEEWRQRADLIVASI